MNYDFLIEIINVTLLCILSLWLLLDSMNSFKKQQLMRCILLTLLIVIAEVGCLLTDNTAPQNRGWSILFNCIGFGATPLLLILESDLYQEHRRKLPWHYIPAVLNGIFVLLSPFRSSIFWVTENNEYLRGPYFNIYLCAFLFSIVYSAVMKLLLVKTLPPVLSVKIIASSSVVLFGALYQVLHPQFHITWLGMSIYFSLVYSFLKEMDGLMDQLTGLLNQNTFHQVALQETYADLKSSRSAVVVLDIDHFKQINDTLGHQQGNEYLRQAAKLLKLAFGAYHRIFRIGGDEFAVILSRTCEEEVRQYLEKLEQLMEKSRQKDEHFPTISYGYAFESPQCGIEQAIKLADMRMYHSKKQKHSQG